MRWLRYCVLVFCLAAGALAMDQKEDWLPITPQDLQVKEVPGDPGASAIQLYYANFIDDSTASEFIYHRIKILNDKGKSWANVEIQFTKDFEEIKDLSARTIHPDGSIVEFSGKPFEKTLIKGRGIKVLVKAFTFPDVTMGSIVEYKYKLHFEHSLTSDNWILQHDLYTYRESFSFKPYQGRLAGSEFREGSRLAWVSLRLSGSNEVKRVKNDNAELEMRNVPAFEAEGFMPPPNNYKPSVHFFYVPANVSSADKYWEHKGQLWSEFLGSFIGEHKEATEAALQAIGSETEPEKKLRKLYARAQEIRNISYEHARSQEELKKENIKPNENVGEVLKHGYGHRWEITRAFVAMARAAGFDASVLLVSDRQSRFFIKEVLSSRQLDEEIADVKLNGQDIYLDPGTKYCPYGLLRWMRTSTPALKPDKKTPTFVTIPPAQQDKAVVRRNVNATLAEDGTLKGDITVQFQGMEALERRLGARGTDDAGKKLDLENELKQWLPAGAEVKLTDVKGWEESETPLVATFTLEVPVYASTAGKRLLVPAYLFQVRQRDAFNHPERKYPFYFSYAFAEVDVVSIKIPDGFSLEGVPPQQTARLPYATYQNTSQLDAGKLVTQRALLFNGIYLPIEKFTELKDFFGKVKAGDEQQAVLRTGVTNAQKSN